MTAPAVWAEERWRDVAPRLGYFLERLPCPPCDADSGIGQLLTAGGFVARCRETGRHVLFADVTGVARAQIVPLEKRYALRAFVYVGLRGPDSSLIEFQLTNSTASWSLFRTRRHAGPITAARPSLFFNPKEKQP